MVGCVVGIALGVLLGGHVGLMERNCGVEFVDVIVGLAVEDAVGTSVGNTMGFMDGVSVGSILGIQVGGDEGTLVSTFVGFREGMVVDHHDGMCRIAAHTGRALS